MMDTTAETTPCLRAFPSERQKWGSLSRMLIWVNPKTNCQTAYQLLTFTQTITAAPTTSMVHKKLFRDIKEMARVLLRQAMVGVTLYLKLLIALIVTLSSSKGFLSYLKDKNWEMKAHQLRKFTTIWPRLARMKIWSNYRSSAPISSRARRNTQRALLRSAGASRILSGIQSPKLTGIW